MALDVSIDQASEKLGTLKKKIAVDGSAILKNISDIAQGINNVWKAEDISIHLNRMEEAKSKLSLYMASLEQEIVNLNNIELDNINNLLKSTSGVVGANIDYLKVEMEQLPAKTFDFVKGSAKLEDNWKDSITKFFAIPNDYVNYANEIFLLFNEVKEVWKNGPEIEEATKKFSDFYDASQAFKICLNNIQSDLVTLMANYSGH